LFKAVGTLIPGTHLILTAQTLYLSNKAEMEDQSEAADGSSVMRVHKSAAGVLS
jgi:hypothetical protein